MSPRLRLAAEAGAFSRDGKVLLIGASAQTDTSVFGGSKLIICQDMMPDAAQWESRGYHVVQSVPVEEFDAAVVFLPRARRAAEDWIARAASVARCIVVDGQKTDGVDALLRETRKRANVSDAVSKAHGKIFWFEPDGAAFDDWRASPLLIDRRWHVVAGIFSADAVDPGSALLAEAIPERLSGRVADLGAGWGYLSATALERCPKITELHLVEAQARALDCARRNVTDPRARFHWADATDWTGARDLDAIVMNPPFHSGRTPDAELGQSFIAAAARLLRPGGTLWMVANRHLPYEHALRAVFADVTEIGGDNRYKLVRAVALSRKRR